MLPPFIIEQIRQREDDERRRRSAEQPRLELPLDDFPRPREAEEESTEDEPERGVVIIDL